VHTIPHVPKYMLPLREVDVMINDLAIEAGVLDNGSQIVTIREDLACEVCAWINHNRKLEMEVASGSISWTLSCAENLTMQIGDVSFTIHAHVVKNVPFRLLLGRPFHNLLLCRLKDQLDGSITISL
jgi:hypothetical protein